MDILSGKVITDPLTADEWNQPMFELQSIIESNGITMSGADLAQATRAIANMIANGQYYIDTGSATAYVLTAPLSQHGLVAYRDGMVVSFIPDNTNTTTTPTVNIETVGAVQIYDKFGNAVEVGDIIANEICTIRYNATSAHWRLMSVGPGIQNGRPFLDVTGTVQNNVTGNSTLYTVQFPTVNANVDSTWNTNDTYVVKYPGPHLITGFVSFTDYIYGTNTTATVSLAANAVAVRSLATAITPDSNTLGSDQLVLQFSTLANFEAGDEITIIAIANGGAGATVDVTSQLEIRPI